MLLNTLSRKSGSDHNCSSLCADLYSEILVHEGDRATARAVIQKTLAGVDWTTNTREKACKYQALLEARLQTLAK